MSRVANNHQKNTQVPPPPRDLHGISHYSKNFAKHQLKDRLSYFDTKIGVCVIAMVTWLDKNMPLKSGFVQLQEIKL